MFHDFIDMLEKFGALGLFIHGMIDAIIFPIPALFLQIPLSVVNPSNALWLATVGFIGCLLGTPIGYWIGRSIGTPVLYRMVKRSWVDKAEKLFSTNGEAAILLGSFTPIPFKVFTILSGALRFPLWKLLAYAAVGRAVKFYAVGSLFYIYGRSAEGMVKDVSLYIFAIGFPLILLFLWFRRKLRIRRMRKQELDVVTEHKTDQEMEQVTRQALMPDQEQEEQVQQNDHEQDKRQVQQQKQEHRHEQVLLQEQEPVHIQEQEQVNAQPNDQVLETDRRQEQVQQQLTSEEQQQEQEPLTGPQQGQIRLIQPRPTE